MVGFVLCFEHDAEGGAGVFPFVFEAVGGDEGECDFVGGVAVVGVEYGVGEALAIPHGESFFEIFFGERGVGFLMGECGEEEEVGVVLPAGVEGGFDAFGFYFFAVDFFEGDEVVVFEGEGVFGLGVDELDFAFVGFVVGGDGFTDF